MRIALFVAASVLLSSALAFAGIIARPPVAAPALAPWGMFGTAAALGISGLYFLINKRK